MILLLAVALPNADCLTLNVGHATLLSSSSPEALREAIIKTMRENGYAEMDGPATARQIQQDSDLADEFKVPETRWDEGAFYVGYFKKSLSTRAGDATMRNDLTLHFAVTRGPKGAEILLESLNYGFGSFDNYFNLVVAQLNKNVPEGVGVGRMVNTPTGRKRCVW